MSLLAIVLLVTLHVLKVEHIFLFVRSFASALRFVCSFMSLRYFVLLYVVDRGNVLFTVAAVQAQIQVTYCC